MRLLFVDDHAMLRQSVAAQLAAAEPGIEIDEAGSLEEALELFAQRSYDLVLSDLSLGAASGLDLIRTASACEPPVPCLAISMYDELERIVAALRAGARGYVTKSSDVDSLIAAVKAVAAGRHYFDETAMTAILGRLLASVPFADSGNASEGDGRFAAYASLTEREQEVFRLLAESISIEAIATRLGISPKTVENHRASIYAKLGFSDRLALFHYARELGLAN